MTPPSAFRSFPEVQPSAELNSQLQGPESELNLSEYVEVLRRRWRLVLILGLLGTVAGLLHYLTTPKAYQARTRILIERRTPSPISNQYAWVFDAWNPQFFPTQYKLLESRGLAERVVVNLRLWEDPKFHPQAPHHDTAPREQAISASQDREVLARLAQRLRGGLLVRPVTDTQLVDIHYRSGDPDFASKVANAYAQAFSEMGITTRRDTATRASEFLGDQIDGLKEELTAKEKEIQRLRRDTDVVSLDPASNVNVQRLEAVNGDYVKARSQRIQKEVRYQELLTTPAESIVDEGSDPVLRPLRNRLSQMEQEYTQKLQIYKPEWPAMVELKAQIESGREQLRVALGDAARRIRESARAEYQTALRGEDALRKELDRMKSDLVDQDLNAVHYNNLKVEITSLRQLLDQMLKMQSETGVAVRGSEESTVRVIEEALSPRVPYQPNRRTDLTTGLVVGLVLGIALVVLLELVDRSIKTSEELERRLGLPTLAVISDVSKKGRKRHGYGYGYGRRSPPNLAPRVTASPLPRTPPIELVPQTSPRLAVSEAYRSLRTALLLSSAEELKVVVITSATAGEGKTATAANLATVMAQLGKRVLLIDADLRKPRVHEVFQVSNRTGVVSYLVGRVPVDEIFSRNGVPNLTVTPSGPIPPNPSELLSSERMRGFIERTRSLFDFVIIDTPPTLAVTDSTLMGSVADGVILCVQAGRASRVDVKACRDRLRLAGVKILGTVLNRYRPPSGPYGKDYYYHYHAYGEAAKASAAQRSAE